MEPWTSSVAYSTDLIFHSQCALYIKVMFDNDVFLLIWIFVLLFYLRFLSKEEKAQHSKVKEVELDPPKARKSELQKENSALQSNSSCIHKQEPDILVESLQHKLEKAEEKNEIDVKDCKILCEIMLAGAHQVPEQLGVSSTSLLLTPDEKCMQDTKVSSRENALLDFLNQNSWTEAEMTKLREEKCELEEALQECNLSRVKLLEMVHALQDDNRKLKRDKSRETANMEYIKNVVLQLLLCESYSVKQHLTTALGSVLLFSPSEISQVKKAQINKLWQS